MLIVSQDKSQIIECKNIIINDNAEIVAVFSDETAFRLGKYGSYEKCQEVIKKIADHYACGADVYNMPPNSRSKSDLKPVTVKDSDSFENLRPYLTTYTFNLLARCGLTSITQIKATQLHKFRYISEKRQKEIWEAIKLYENYFK